MQLNEGAPAHPRQAESALLARRRRRKSLGALRAHGANTSADPTSPEVISSLISSLSTISVPLNSHFETIPRIDSKDSSDPGLPEVPHTAPCFTIPPSQQHGFGMSYGTYATAEEPPPNAPFLHPDDAASSPVIRMARAPPSPKSPRSPRSPRFKPFSKSAELSPRPASRDSHTSVRVAPTEDTAFGTISTEPGPRTSTANSIASNSSAGRTRSLKGQFGLLKKPSREFTSDKESPSIRKTSSHNDTLRHNAPRNRASLRSLHSMANVAEETGPNGFAEESSEYLVASTPPSKEHLPDQETPDAHHPGGIGSGRIIPTRDSSLRHHHSQSSSSKKKRSGHHSRYSSTGSNKSGAENGSPGTSNDAEQVTRRIQEVKDQQQKIKTDLGSDATSVKTSPSTSAQHRKPLRGSSSVDQHRTAPSVAQTEPRNDRPPLNDSAPSPFVMTGKSRSFKSGQPMASKPTNFSPQGPRSPPSEKFDYDKRYRPSLDPVTPTKQHRRSPSGHVSAGRSSLNTERPSSADSIDLAVEDYVFSPKLTQRVIHPTTGRTIAFSEVGDPRGHVVLCCLGMGLTRYLMAFYDELARTLNLRLVTLDRPGVGESGPHQVDEPSTPLSWPGKSFLLNIVELGI